LTNVLLQSVTKLPKIELHRHLEGSLRLKTLVAIAIENGLTLPSFSIDELRPFVQMMPDEPRSWQQFLGKFQVLRQFYRSKTIIQRVTREVIADAAADNVRYMELRFTPQALNNLMHCAYDEVVDWVCEAASAASSQYNIRCNLILSMNRHESTDIGEEVLKAALNFKDRGVVGIDLAGQEAGFSAQPFARIFEHAKAEGLGITVHAGEWLGADSVAEAIQALGATRIGHGVRAHEDPRVIAMLIEHGVTLEVCPTSNIDSGAVSTYAQHPLRDLYQAGVRTTLNTDDPLISDITLSDEYAAAMHHLNFTADDIGRHIIMAAEAAFLPESQRAELVAQFQTWISESQRQNL